MISSRLPRKVKPFVSLACLTFWSSEVVDAAPAKVDPTIATSIKIKTLISGTSPVETAERTGFRGLYLSAWLGRSLVKLLYGIFSPHSFKTAVIKPTRQERETEG
jgi:hypothetical protein